MDGNGADVVSFGPCLLCFTHVHAFRAGHKSAVDYPISPAQKAEKMWSKRDYIRSMLSMGAPRYMSGYLFYGDPAERITLCEPVDFL